MKFERLLSVLACSLLAIVAGCVSRGDDDDAEIEGDEAGECSDGVDNDQDGPVDCDDPGCFTATACVGDDDDSAGDDDDSGDCPDLFESDPDACDETFCGPPLVYAATGNSAETFLVLGDGAELPVFYGQQGGYHLDLALQMENLCQVVFIDFELFDTSAGGEVLIHSATRHIQTVRVEGGEPPSLQRWWTEQFRFPCSWWPDDPDHDPPCNEAQVGRIEDVDLLLRVSAADHNKNRSGSEEVQINAECCTE